MTLEQLEELMFTQDITRVMNVLETHLIITNIFKSLEEYEPQFHKVMKKEHRMDKFIKDDKGITIKTIPVARLPIAFQKKIVLMAAAFLGTPCVDSTPEGQVEENMAEMIEEIWSANKLDYKFKTIAKITMSERHCAELWYTQDVDESYWDGFPLDSKFRLSMKLIANSLGDRLYPVFDEFNNLIAFGRSYETREIVNDRVEMVIHFDLYTADKLYFSKKQNSVWLFSADGSNFAAGEIQFASNPIGKIPVIYYSQPATEWHDVQDLIDQLEKKLSNHSDTNQYFDSPIVFAEGDVEGFAEKGEEGKVIIGKNGAKVSYLTWDNAPESTKMEITNLLYFIHTMTHTPDISFENMKGLGHFSGVALKMLFIDAHMKAADKEEIFGEGLQRRINYIKKAISVLDPSFREALPMKVSPKFKYFMPEDIPDTITTLNAAVAGGIMSTESAIRQNPMVDDADAEIAAIDREKADNQAKSLAIANAAKPTPPLKAVPNSTPEPAYGG